MPGAFTPTCSKNHLPGFVKNAAAIKAKGIDAIAVTAVNDPFVMAAWKKAAGSDDSRIPRRRQRRFRQGHRPRTRCLGRRSRHALQALLHGDRRRRGEVAGDRGRARQGAMSPARDALLKSLGSLVMRRMPAASRPAASLLSGSLRRAGHFALRPRSPRSPPARVHPRARSGHARHGP